MTRHFRFINSKTGNTVHYYSTTETDERKLKAELEKINEQVATRNNVFSGTIYWEEIAEK